MRRSRAPLTAWPAFADLMTILAVVSLAIAAIVSVRNPEIEELEGRRAELRRQLDDANKMIAELQRQVAELRRQLSPEPGGDPVADLRHRFGDLPCLYQQGPPITVVPLLRVVVASEYVVTPLLPRERDADVDAIPGLDNGIEHRQMDAEVFERYSNAIYQYGDLDKTFGGSCRFFVELKQGRTDPLAFSRAYAVVSRYFLISNSGEVLGILRGEE